MTPTTREWVGTLNALAKTTGLGAAAAACRLAGLPVGSLDTLGALNIKAGNGSSPAAWRGLAAVCNQLAGTTNLEPLLALQLYLATGGGGGGTDDMQLITSKVLATAAASIDFASIPSSYNLLRLIAIGRSANSTADEWMVRFNADSSAGHYTIAGVGNANGTISARDGESLNTGLGTNSLDLPGTEAASGDVSILELEIPGYSLTTFHKIGHLRAGYVDTTGGNLVYDFGIGSGVWLNTAAVNELTIVTNSGSNLLAGTAAFLYGY